MSEMVHLKRILSQYNITNGSQVDSLEKPLNNQGIEVTQECGGCWGGGAGHPYPKGYFFNNL